MGDYHEYIVTLRVRVQSPHPDFRLWDWYRALDGAPGTITVDSQTATGAMFQMDDESSSLVPIDFVAEPKRLLGRWVTVSWDTGRGRMVDSGTLLAVHSDHLQVQAGQLGATRTIPLSLVKALGPSKEPSKR